MVHLTFCAPQIVVRGRVHANVYLALHLLQGKVNVRSLPPTINPEPSLSIQTLFYRESVYLEPSNQTTFCQLCLKTINMVGRSSVCWSKTARLLVNILIGTSRICRNEDFVQITQMTSNIRCVVVY